MESGDLRFGDPQVSCRDHWVNTANLREREVRRERTHSPSGPWCHYKGLVKTKGIFKKLLWR